MGKLFRLLGIFLVIVLLALPLTACRPWEGAITLIVTIDAPQDGATVTTSPVTVSGTLNKTATVKINGVTVAHSGGKFSSSVNLTEGSNTINVVATAGEETSSKTVTITYAPAKQ